MNSDILIISYPHHPYISSSSLYIQIPFIFWQHQWPPSTESFLGSKRLFNLEIMLRSASSLTLRPGNAPMERSIWKKVGNANILKILGKQKIWKGQLEPFKVDVSEKMLTGNLLSRLCHGIIQNHHHHHLYGGQAILHPTTWLQPLACEQASGQVLLVEVLEDILTPANEDPLQGSM